MMGSINEEDVDLIERTEQYDSRFVGFVSENIFDRKKVGRDANNHTVEVLNVSSSASHDQYSERSTDDSDMPAATVLLVKDGFEGSVDEVVIAATTNDDDNDDHDIDEKKARIDSVFFACDPACTGTVAVSDVITYLSDTLQVINSLYVYTLPERIRYDTIR